MAASWRGDAVSAGELRQAIRHLPEVRAALERMWPVLTPAQLLHDLFGSPALLRLAAGGILDDAEIESLHRPRADDVADVRWTAADVALLDDAREALGPKPGRGGKIAESDEIRTYGHIVVDEVQDLTPMQLKMATRRSLNGSLTVVGDLAQATGALAPDGWDDVLAHLPDRKPARVVGLSRRLPHPGADHGPRRPRDGGRDAGPALTTRRADRRRRARRSSRPTGDLAAAVAEATAKMAAELPAAAWPSSSPTGSPTTISAGLTAAGIDHGRATRTGLDDAVTVVPVSVVKGLELDGVVVVEPARIVERRAAGLARPLRRPDPADATAHRGPRRRRCRNRSAKRRPQPTRSRNERRATAPAAGSWSIHQWPSPSSTATSAPNRCAERRASSSPPVYWSSVAMITRPGRRSAASSSRPHSVIAGCAAER